MKRYALIAAAATLLSGCVDRFNQVTDCDGATTGQMEFDACLKASNNAQYEAHRKVVKDYAAKS